MSAADHARQPAGTPTGGQFAAIQHGEAEVGLGSAQAAVDAGMDTGQDDVGESGTDLGAASEHKVTNTDVRTITQSQWECDFQVFRAGIEKYNSACTYSFPPAPRDACQVEAFWNSVNIPDPVLSQFQAAYPAARQQLLTGWVNHAMADDPEPKEPFLGKTKKYQTDLAGWLQRRVAKAAELAVHVGPPELPAHEVRPALRAIMTAQDLKVLPGQDRCPFIDQTNDEILDERLGATSYRLMEQYYAAGQMSKSVFRDPGNDVAARMTELSSTMRAVHEEVAALRDSQELDVATRGARTEKEVLQMARAAGFTQN